MIIMIIQYYYNIILQYYIEYNNFIVFILNIKDFALQRWFTPYLSCVIILIYFSYQPLDGYTCIFLSYI